MATSDVPFPDTVAVIGRAGAIVGAVWRPGDPLKHLSPPDGLGIPAWSRLFQTRCGLDGGDGAWQSCDADDDVWCPACLRQAGIAHREEPM